MRTEYYVEFVIPNSREPYAMQSKWFKTKRKAKNWINNYFDFISYSGNIKIYIMSAVFDEDDVMIGDINQEEECII